jgi:hypothetical protein
MCMILMETKIWYMRSRFVQKDLILPLDLQRLSHPCMKDILPSAFTFRRTWVGQEGSHARFLS